MNDQTQKAVAELRKGCQCLFIEVDSSVAGDIKNRAESLITAFTAELEAMKRESEETLATLRANHVTDMRVTNESAHFHILECKRLREELEAAQREIDRHRATNPASLRASNGAIRNLLEEYENKMREAQRERDQAQARLAEAEAQRERFRVALNKIGYLEGGLTDESYCGRTAREALAQEEKK